MFTDVVDAQVHANRLAPRWRTESIPSSVDAAIAAMDAVGVAALMHDEYAGLDPEGNVLPGAPGPGGVWRSTYPFSLEAVSRYPDRFVYLSHIEHNDPELDTLLAAARATPGCLGLRIAKFDRERVAARIAAGDFDQLFASAERLKFPICLNLPYNTSVLLPALERYPRLSFILDHFGVRFPDLNEPAPGRYDVLNQILVWSTYKNLFLKVSHVEWLSLDGYPFADMVPYLRKLIDAYGANRIMWGVMRPRRRTRRGRRGLAPGERPFTICLTRRTFRGTKRIGFSDGHSAKCSTGSKRRAGLLSRLADRR